jgi:hypothetical protein
MNEAVKIDVKMNRKTILLLSSLIDAGLKDEDGTSELLKLVSAEGVEELKSFTEECLKKAGLKELSEKMKGLSGK